MNGLVNGDGPSDPNKRAIWLLNHQPNSIQVGNVTIPFQGLGKIGVQLRFAANMAETAAGWSSEDGDKLALSFIEGLTHSVLDDTWTSGIKNVLDAVYHPQEYGESYLNHFAQSWLPLSVGQSQIAGVIDPFNREAHDILDVARYKTPFLSEELYPVRDRFGQPVPKAGNVQTYANDPVVQRMEVLQMGIGKLDNKINGIKLTPKQYDDYSTIAGQLTKNNLNRLIEQPGFAAQQPFLQHQQITKIIDKSRANARAVILMQNPVLIQQAYQHKMGLTK